MSVCRVLIQKTSRSGRASGSQCSRLSIIDLQVLLDAIFLGLGDVELKSHTVYYEIARTRRLIVHSK